ncbi:hypothetical protein ACJX0J_009367, partial [Zea mays]
ATEVISIIQTFELRDGYDIFFLFFHIKTKYYKRIWNIDNIEYKPLLIISAIICVYNIKIITLNLYLEILSNDQKHKLYIIK